MDPSWRWPSTDADSVLPGRAGAARPLRQFGGGPTLFLALTDSPDDDDPQDGGGELEELGDDQEQAGQAQGEPRGRILDEAPQARIQDRGEDEQAPPPGEPGRRGPPLYRGVRL